MLDVNPTGSYSLAVMSGNCTGSNDKAAASPFVMLAELLSAAIMNADGSIKEGSKLAELLGKFLDENPEKYGTPGQHGSSWQDALSNGQNKVDANLLQQLLGDMIGNKLGVQPGGSGGTQLADALFKQSGGSPWGHSHAGNSPSILPYPLDDLLNNGQAGGLPDFRGDDFIGQLMQFLSGLGSETLGGLLHKDANGGSTFSNDDMEVLKQVALYMDQNPKEFGQPHDANGEVRSWVDELGEDNYLNTEETAKFEQAIGNIGEKMGSFANFGNGSAQGGGLFGDDVDLTDPGSISLNLGASTAAFNIIALLFGKSGASTTALP